MSRSRYWADPRAGQYEFWVENANDRNEDEATDFTVRLTLGDQVVFEQRFDDAAPEYEKLPVHVLHVPEAEPSAAGQPVTGACSQTYGRLLALIIAH